MYSNCAFVNVVATTNLLPGMTKLEIVEGDKRMEVGLTQMHPLITGTSRFRSESHEKLLRIVSSSV